MLKITVTNHDIDVDDFFEIYDDMVISKSQQYDNIRFMITNI